MFDPPTFRSRPLWRQAMTHKSYANEYPEAGGHNERLEFLGDAILTFLSGELLYKRYPHKPEGDLTPLRAALVDEKQLGKFAVALNLDQHLRLSKGVERSGGRTNPRLLSSAFEAMIGAYFLDANSNIQVVRAYVEPLFESVVDTLAVSAPNVNFKSRFQAWALEVVGKIPEYCIIHEVGPDHAKEFTAEVQVNNRVYGQGKGRKKQEAEKQAAQNALDSLGLL